MADNETIADILAEKRRRADEIERDCDEKMKRGEMTSDQYARELVADIRREADRLEAAHRRERGDCARLREALETLADVVETWQDHLPSAIREGELAKAIEKAEAALATTSNQNTQEN